MDSSGHILSGRVGSRVLEPFEKFPSAPEPSARSVKDLLKGHADMEQRDRTTLEVVESEFDSWTLLKHIHTRQQQTTNQTIGYLNYCFSSVERQQR